jgi:hypothetical protein
MVISKRRAINMMWFKHMTNMRHDVKMRRLIAKYGIEGYGLYCAILESIVESMDTESPMPDLEENSTDIATMFKMDTVRVEEIMLFCMEQGLFEQDEISGHLLCHKVYKFLETNQTRSTQMRQMISQYKTKKSPQIPQKTPSQSVLDKCEEENRREENRIEIEQEGSDLLPFSSPEFAKAWKSWEIYNKQKKHPLLPVSATMQLEEMKTMGEKRAINAINHSIKSNYKGLYEQKQSGSFSQDNTPKHTESGDYGYSDHKDY